MGVSWGDFNGKVLTNKNLKNLTEQLRLRGRQEHYDAYVEGGVEDLVIRQQEDGTEVVEFRDRPTNRSVNQAKNYTTSYV